MLDKTFFLTTIVLPSKVFLSRNLIRVRQIVQLYLDSLAVVPVQVMKAHHEGEDDKDK